MKQLVREVNTKSFMSVKRGVGYQKLTAKFRCGDMDFCPGLNKIMRDFMVYHQSQQINTIILIRT